MISLGFHYIISPFTLLNYLPLTEMMAQNELVTGVILDPSLPEEERLTGKSRTSKMIIGATKYDADRYGVKCFPGPETMRRVESEWGKYGIRGRNITTSALRPEERYQI